MLYRINWYAVLALIFAYLYVHKNPVIGSVYIAAFLIIVNTNGLIKDKEK